MEKFFSSVCGLKVLVYEALGYWCCLMRTACTACAAGHLSFRCDVWVPVCDTLLFVQATFNPSEARCSASNAIALAITTRSSAGRVYATCALQGLDGIHSAGLARSALSLNACAGSGQHMSQVPRVHVCRKQDCVPVQGRCVRDRVPTSNLSISCMGRSHAGYRASKGFYKKQGVGEQVTHTHIQLSCFEPALTARVIDLVDVGTLGGKLSTATSRLSDL